jgi:hypothetical protein
MSASRLTPSVYTHSSRPEWGRAVVAEELADRTTYVFENAGERTFMNEPSRLETVELPADEREALAKTLLRTRAPARAKKKRAPAKPRKKKEKAAAKAPEAAAEAE